MRLSSLNLRSRYAIIGAAVFIICISVLFSDSIEDLVTGGGGTASIGLVQTATGTVTNLVITAIDNTGYLGIFGLMLLEGTSLPIPSEVVLPFAGYLVPGAHRFLGDRHIGDFCGSNRRAHRLLYRPLPRNEGNLELRE